MVWSVEIENLSVQYPGAQKSALDRCDLKIAEGVFYGLLGPNGAGKTTLISFLCGQIEGRYDRARILGHDRGETDLYKRKVGYAPQEIALYPMLTARENLCFFARLLDLATTEVDRVLEWVGLTSRQQDLVAEFSGGMKRRLNLGVALLSRPRLLILDEPTVGIDPQSRNFIFTKLLELKREGVTLIYSTHYLGELKNLCDQVGILQQGRVTSTGPTADILGSDFERRYLELTGRGVE